MDENCSQEKITMDDEDDIDDDEDDDDCDSRSEDEAFYSVYKKDHNQQSYSVCSGYQHITTYKRIT
jgi:hypothetical protein